MGAGHKKTTIPAGRPSSSAPLARRQQQRKTDERHRCADGEMGAIAPHRASSHAAPEAQAQEERALQVERGVIGRKVGPDQAAQSVGHGAGSADPPGETDQRGEHTPGEEGRGNPAPRLRIRGKTAHQRVEQQRRHHEIGHALDVAGPVPHMQRGRAEDEPAQRQPVEARQGPAWPR
ncbi:MAG: hypothetical protein H6644_04775 [Caldilineaceae bacterium]|nr:hypothetical protein [Caldilineaceae bacterium]